MPAKVNRIHLIGIGGIGMSALARYFLSEGYKITGSDLSPSDTIDELKKEGVRIVIGHKSSVIGHGVNLVIYNQAIPSSNIELRTARKLGLPCRSYPEVIGELTRKYKTIAIAGSHGKSTTTALISLILIEAGFDPTVIIGTKLKEFGGKNFRSGKSEWLVLEADEWMGSFWHYSPVIGAITNIDREHLDFYKTFPNVKRAFEKFKKNCEALVAVSRQARAAENKIKKILKIPGRHNVENAILAYSIGRYLKISESTILKALGKYRGAWRRMEYRGEFPISNFQFPIKVYDDYAHHPTEIKATLSAFCEKYPRNALICVFQAHQAERLKLLFNDFKTAFKDADKVILLPEYKVAGREEKFDKKHDAKALAKETRAIYVKNPKKNLKSLLMNLITNYQSPITIIMMGAGDIIKYTDVLLRR